MTTDSSHTPSIDELEAVFVGNAGLARIARHLSRFNPLRVMNVERMEIRHSSVLGWLLDPNETHGLGDRFLKGFLAETLRGQSARGVPAALDIARADLSDAEVRREWRDIDLFVRSPRLGWAFVIENKLGSKQHGGQLRRYLDDAIRFHEGRMGGKATRGVFLTLNDEAPKDERYLAVRYDTIYALVREVLDAPDAPLAPTVRTFLEHYADVLAEATGVSTEQDDMEELARQLYRENKRVLDFVIQHGTASDLAIAADSLWSERPDRFGAFEVGGRAFRFASLSSRYLSFLPTAWFDAVGGATPWSGCEGWWAGLPVICFFEMTPASNGHGGRLALVAEIGPVADHGLRVRMIERIEGAAEANPKLRIAFTKGAAAEGRKYSRFFKRNKDAIKDIQDADELANAMMNLLAGFEEEFGAVATVLDGFSPPRSGGGGHAH